MDLLGWYLRLPEFIWSNHTATAERNAPENSASRDVSYSLPGNVDHGGRNRYSMQNVKHGWHAVVFTNKKDYYKTPAISNNESETMHTTRML